MQLLTRWVEERKWPCKPHERHPNHSHSIMSPAGVWQEVCIYILNGPEGKGQNTPTTAPSWEAHFPRNFHQPPEAHHKSTIQHSSTSMTFHQTHFLRGWSKSTPTQSTIFDSLSDCARHSTWVLTSLTDWTGMEGQWRGVVKGQRSRPGPTSRPGLPALAYTCIAHGRMDTPSHQIRANLFEVPQDIKSFDLALMWAITVLLFMATSCRLPGSSWPHPALHVWLPRATLPPTWHLK